MNKMKTFKNTEQPVWDQLVNMQTLDEIECKTTDVHLVCPDGHVPVHGFLFQSVSPFFRAIFKTQGDYPAVRNVLLPDYDIRTIRSVVQFIYSGWVNVSSKNEANAIKKILLEWRIEHKDVEFLTNPKNYQKQNKIIFYIFSNENTANDSEKTVELQQTQTPTVATTKVEVKSEDLSHDSASATSEPVVSPETEAKKPARETRFLRPRSTLKKRIHLNNDSDETESVGGHSDSPELSSSSSESESEVSPPRRSGRNSKLPTLVPPGTSRSTRFSSTRKIPEYINSDNDDESTALSTSSGADDDDTDTSRPKAVKEDKNNGKSKSMTGNAARKIAQVTPIRPAALPKASGDSSLRKASSSSSDSDSESDSESKSWYKNPNLFAEAARKCGKCKKTYSTPKEASDCITERHKLVRCYFCFDVCENTEKLFLHYGDKHKKAGREKTLLCPFCQQAIPYKSVSTHVISNHLFAKQGGPAKTPGAPVPQGRPSHEPDSKRLRTDKQTEQKEVKLNKTGGKKNDESEESNSSDDNLKVSSSNMLIKKRDASGKMKVFQIEKGKQ